MSGMRRRRTNDKDFKLEAARFGILNFGHCDLFEICYLLFGIFCNSDTLTTGRKSYAAKDELRWNLRLFYSISTVLL